MLQASRLLSCMAPPVGRCSLPPPKFHRSPWGEMRMGFGPVCVSTWFYILPQGISAGLALRLSAVGLLHL